MCAVVRNINDSHFTLFCQSEVTCVSFSESSFFFECLIEIKDLISALQFVSVCHYWLIQCTHIILYFILLKNANIKFEILLI